MPKPLRDFILEKVSEHPTDIVAIVRRRYGVSQQAVQKQIAALMKANLLEKSGTTRGTKYFLKKAAMLARPAHRATQILDHLSRSYEAKDFRKRGEQQIWDETLKEAFSKMPPNIRTLFEYGTTEMVNNVIDHSQARHLSIDYRLSPGLIQVTVFDDGIGIFRKIQKALKLDDVREGILHLSKGKFTTDQVRHSGEGIFFSSRAFDGFTLHANGVMYGRINSSSDQDWMVGSAEESRGTIVTMELSPKSTRKLDEVFESYAPGDKRSFSKTHIQVSLGLNPGETYISRSQARRILLGLEKFKYITFDFKRVSTVGQGFVDEVFRVFKNQHPSIEISSMNANGNVDFMIKRSLA